MANVTYDDRSFLVDGERIWLVSGSIHYFRVPAELWRDRLLKAKRSGLNCICTYVPWNFHEPREGEWNLTGDHDLVEFVRLAGELDLYVILRPGPYICSEWDFGGLPAWLTTKSGMAYRTSNAAYTHYFDKYFRQVLPRLAEHQVSHGGNIILIQNENEYLMTTMPDRLNYLTFISQLFRRSGFDIPIISCNYLSEPEVPDCIDSCNGFERVIESLKKTRLHQPNAPLLIPEFWSGWHEAWGDDHFSARGAVESARHALEILGCGGQYNYYMWHGGTNFGFWASKLDYGEATYQTTSYDHAAPLAEGGGLTEKYYLTKLVNMFGQHMGKYIASCAMGEPGTSVHNATNVLNMYGPDGRWAVISNGGRDDIESVDISLPEGKHLNVSLQPFGAAAVPIDLQLTATETLDYCNLMPLGFFGQSILVLHGPVGWKGCLSVNGKEIEVTVPELDEPQCVEHEELLIVLVNSELAKRTWLVEDTLVFGPKFVGETLDDIENSPGAKQYTLISPEGKLSHRKIKPAPATRRTAPKLGQWSRRQVCTEPVAKNLQWEPMDGPADVDSLGIHYGYLWYRMEIDSDRIRKRYVFLPDCEDRATLFLNGKYLGVWGRGEGAKRLPIGASFKRGKNVLVALLDNMGRHNFGPRLGSLKGIYGHVFDAKPLRTKKFKLKQLETFPKRLVPRSRIHLIPEMKKLPVFQAELDIPLTKVTPIHLSFPDFPGHVAVLCNERMVGFFEGPWENTSYGDVTLGPELKRGKNLIKLIAWGDVTTETLDSVKFHILSENLTLTANWSVREWEVPQDQGPIVGKNQPAWYVSKFKYSPSDCPLFLKILGAHKGQVFINGHNAGRFWNIGPQQHYYLPECWLQEVNELMIFDESGQIPSGSRLEFRPLGPYQD